MAKLEDLLVDTRELDRGLAAALLAPYLRIDRTSCTIIPQDGWLQLSNDGRILLYLVARRAMRALGLPLAEEAATPVEIARATGIPGGSVRPALKRLLKSRLVESDLARGYIVPNYALPRVRGAARGWRADVAA